MKKPLISNLKQKLVDKWLHSVESIDNFVTQIEPKLGALMYPKVHSKGDLLSWEQQHVVPKVYLDKFILPWDTGLYYYSLIKSDFVTNFQISTRWIWKKTDYYVIDDIHWKRNYFFEKFLFSSYLERGYSKIVEKISLWDILSDEDWNILSWFIAYQYVRTPKFINWLKAKWDLMIQKKLKPDFQSWDHSEILKEFCDSEEDIKNAIEYIQEGNYEISISEKSAILESLKIWNDFWMDFKCAKYEILQTRKSWHFLCSDNPFFIIPPLNYPRSLWVWLVLPFEARKIIPISRNLAISITFFHERVEPSISYRTINQKETDLINTYICKNANEHILWSDIQYMTSIIKKIDFNRVQKDLSRPRVQINKDLWIVAVNNYYPY